MQPDKTLVFDSLAFDGGESKRHYDENRFLRVDISPLTKEQVAPYLGREVPDYQRLGLDPNKLYHVYRPAAELSSPETIASVNNIPIQLDHHLENPDNPPKSTRIGTTGEAAKWQAPYLMNSLTFWDTHAIKLIENNTMRELSLGYAYTPIMKSGTFHGEKYDLVMKDIRANHLALVEQGRAGRDVLVMDSRPKSLSPTKDKQTMDNNEMNAKLAALVAEMSNLLANNAQGGQAPDPTADEEIEDVQDGDLGCDEDGTEEGAGYDDDAPAELENEPDDELDMTDADAPDALPDDDLSEDEDDVTEDEDDFTEDEDEIVDDEGCAEDEDDFTADEDEVAEDEDEDELAADEDDPALSEDEGDPECTEDEDAPELEAQDDGEIDFSKLDPRTLKLLKKCDMLDKPAEMIEAFLERFQKHLNDREVPTDMAVTGDSAKQVKGRVKASALSPVLKQDARRIQAMRSLAQDKALRRKKAAAQAAQKTQAKAAAAARKLAQDSALKRKLAAVKQQGIAKGRELALKDLKARYRAATETKDILGPHVLNSMFAFDSAAAIYAQALKKGGVSVPAKLTTSAARAMFQAYAKGKQQRRKVVALDSANNVNGYNRSQLTELGAYLQGQLHY